MEQDGEELAPGASPLDEVLPDLVQGLGRSRVHAQEGAEDIDADEGSDEPVADPGADRGSTLPMTGIPALYGEDDPLAPAAEEVDPVDTAEPDLEPGEEA